MSSDRSVNFPYTGGHTGLLGEAFRIVADDFEKYNLSLSRAQAWGAGGVILLAISSLATGLAPILIKSLSERAFSVITGSGFFFTILAVACLYQQRKNLSQFHLSMPTFTKTRAPYAPSREMQDAFNRAETVVTEIRKLEQEQNPASGHYGDRDPRYLDPIYDKWTAVHWPRMPSTAVIESFPDRKPEIQDLNTRLQRHNENTSNIRIGNGMALGFAAIQAIILIAAKILLSKDVLLAAAAIGAINILLNVALLKKLDPLSFKMPILVKLEQAKSGVTSVSEEECRRELSHRLSRLPDLERHLRYLKACQAQRTAPAVPAVAPTSELPLTPGAN